MKLKLYALVSAVFVALGIATLASSPSSADPSAPACARKDFKTKMVKEACAAGGQLAAKTAMRKFVADHKIAACAECHATQAPNYKLKDTALKRYQELGGK